MDARIAAQGLSPLADNAHARLGQAEHPADRLPGRLLLRRPQGEEGTGVAGRSRSRNPARLRKAGHPHRRTGGAGGRHRQPQNRRRCGVRFGQRRHHFPQGTRSGGRHLPLDQRGRPRISGTRQTLARQNRPHARQFLRGIELRGLFRRHLRLHSRGRALPDGTQHLFPHQRRKHGAIRTHADRRRQGQLCQLFGRLHRPHAR